MNNSIPDTAKHIKKNKYILRPSWRMYLLILILGVGLLAVMRYSFDTGNRMNMFYSPLIEAAINIKLEATIAHLWLEEIISGDRSEDMKSVWTHLNQAEWYANAMLEGGENPRGEIPPLTDEKMRQEIREVQSHLKEVRNVTSKRIESIRISGIGSEIDQHYDSIYMDFVNQADRVETGLKQVMYEDLAHFKRTQYLLYKTAFFLPLMIGLGFWYFNRRLTKSLVSLQIAHESLNQEITERIQAEADLTESESEMRALAIRLEEVEESERKRLSRELHDRAGSNLTALNINLSIMEGLLTAEIAEEVKSRLTDSMNLVEDTTEIIRDVMGSLRPQVLDDYGLTAAMHWYGDRLSKRTGIKILFQGEDLQNRLTQETETAFFRIVQEAMNNVIKHAQADRIIINLDETDDMVQLRIIDNGRGFDMADFKKREQSGWGLINMRERAQFVGGQLLIDSNPGQGTQIIIQIKK